LAKVLVAVVFLPVVDFLAVVFVVALVVAFVVGLVVAFVDFVVFVVTLVAVFAAGLTTVLTVKVLPVVFLEPVVFLLVFGCTMSAIIDMTPDLLPDFVVDLPESLDARRFLIMRVAEVFFFIPGSVTRIGGSVKRRHSSSG
jgi:hypothetical protein